MFVREFLDLVNGGGQSYPNCGQRIPSPKVSGQIKWRNWLNHQYSSLCVSSLWMQHDIIFLTHLPWRTVPSDCEPKHTLPSFNYFCPVFYWTKSGITNIVNLVLYAFFERVVDLSELSTLFPWSCQNAYFKNILFDHKLLSYFSWHIFIILGAMS